MVRNLASLSRDLIQLLERSSQEVSWCHGNCCLIRTLLSQLKDALGFCIFLSLVRNGKVFGYDLSDLGYVTIRMLISESSGRAQYFYRYQVDPSRLKYTREVYEKIYKSMPHHQPPEMNFKFCTLCGYSHYSNSHNSRCWKVDLAKPKAETLKPYFMRTSLSDNTVNTLPYLNWLFGL